MIQHVEMFDLMGRCIQYTKWKKGELSMGTKQYTSSCYVLFDGPSPPVSKLTKPVSLGAGVV